MTKACLEPSCTQEYYGRGYCKRHYSIARSNGLLPRLAPVPVKQKILNSVNVMPGGCWNWKRSLNNKGYGQMQSPDGKGLKYSHRVAYEAWIGKIPAGINVLHRCDNPPCCNPEHLRLGTQKDNCADMIMKGRNAPPPSLRLKADQVLEIRKLIVTGAITKTAIGKLFGIHHAYVGQIGRREVWKGI